MTRLRRLRDRLRTVTRNLRVTRTERIPTHQRKARSFDQQAEHKRIRADELLAEARVCEQRRRHHVGQVKRLVAVQKDRRILRAELLAEIKELEKETVRVDLSVPNRVTGGTPGQRFRAAALKAIELDMARGHRYYSQAGSWNLDHVISGEPSGSGIRSDCSQWILGLMKACGLPDPYGANFTAGGYTGTMAYPKPGTGWKQVSRDALIRKGWGYVIYGSGTGFHTEAYIGPSDRTGGHGDARVNYGVIDLFGDGNYRCYIYDPD